LSWHFYHARLSGIEYEHKIFRKKTPGKSKPGDVSGAHHMAKIRLPRSIFMRGSADRAKIG